MRPLVTVEKPALKNVVKGLSSFFPPCRSTLNTDLARKQKTILDNMKPVFSRVNHFCTTADIWSCRHKSYLGVTAHFIDENTLKRKSAMLSCRRIQHSHTFNIIGKNIFDVHKAFNISAKVVGTVTDNAANFGKAFKIYSVPESVVDQTIFLNDDDISVDVLELPDFGTYTDDNYIEDEVQLPVHYRCFSHTLHLLATRDASKAIENKFFATTYNSIMGKLTALWSLSNQSTVASDKIFDICQKITHTMFH